MNGDKEKKSSLEFIAIQSITLARVPLALVFTLSLVFMGQVKKWIVFYFLMLVVIEATDAFDGIAARHFDITSELGATLDPYADSISRLVVYWGLAHAGLVIFFVPLAMAVRDITVAYSRILLAQKRHTVAARLSGKIKAVVQSIGSGLVLFGPFYWEYTGKWVFYFLSWLIITVTLLSMVEYVRDALRVRKIDR
ncbi:MAG: CDP-alcohol phosphatidyltransferase family protein [Candidatus Aminicenantes bacterium]|nr:CDP-alcohol phosphatidyltransferase family protein [Candidatus Aminicenantes bacterium]